MHKTVRVIARALAKPDKIEELKRILLEAAVPTQKEAGCLRYEICQNKDVPSEFIAVEEWADQAAIDRHMATPHVKTLFEKIPALLAQPPELKTFVPAD